MEVVEAENNVIERLEGIVNMLNGQLAGLAQMGTVMQNHGSRYVFQQLYNRIASLLEKHLLSVRTAANIQSSPSELAQIKIFDVKNGTNAKLFQSQIAQYRSAKVPIIDRVETISHKVTELCQKLYAEDRYKDIFLMNKEDSFKLFLDPICEILRENTDVKFNVVGERHMLGKRPLYEFFSICSFHATAMQLTLEKWREVYNNIEEEDKINLEWDMFTSWALIFDGQALELRSANLDDGEVYYEVKEVCTVPLEITWETMENMIRFFIKVAMVVYGTEALLTELFNKLKKRNVLLQREKRRTSPKIAADTFGDAVRHQRATPKCCECLDDGDDDDDYEDDEDDTMTDEQRMEKGRRMFQIFAAKMFEQRVLTAYREKQRFLEELEKEERLKELSEEHKQKNKEKKKAQKRILKQQKEEERLQKNVRDWRKKRGLRRRKKESGRTKIFILKNGSIICTSINSAIPERLKREVERAKREEERRLKEEAERQKREAERQQNEEQERRAQKDAALQAKAAAKAKPQQPVSTAPVRTQTQPAIRAVPIITAVTIPRYKISLSMVKPPTLKTDTQQLSLPQSQQTAFADYDQTSLVYPSIGPSGFWADPAMKPPQPPLTRNLSSSSASLLSKMKSVGFIGHSKTNMPALIPALIGLPTPIQRPENSEKKVGTPTVQEDDDGVIGTKNLGGEILKDEERKSFGHFSFSSGIWNAPGSNGRLVRNNSTGSSAVIGSYEVLGNGIPTTTRLFEQEVEHGIR
ncbi:hypothetical protein HK098_004997 [Nowakowskiella sp. JEL0407]|nr:hypothetical protein HK098_004997 [Nowakowskiella sp. JEL0407]